MSCGARTMRGALCALLLPGLAMSAPTDRLLVGLGARIIGVSLQTGQQSLVAELPSSSAGTLADAGPHGLLISDNVAGRLYLADLATGNVRLLREGSHAIYVRELDALVFYATLDGTPGLWLADMREPAARPRRLDDAPPGLRQRPVQVSATELLVQRARGGDPETAARPDAVAKIDLRSGEITAQPGLEDCRVIPVWRAQAQQVACWARGPTTGALTGDAFFSSLDGAARLSLPAGHIPVAATPGDDEIVVATATAGGAGEEHWSLERFAPASGQLTPLADGLPVKAEAATWEIAAGE